MSETGGLPPAVLRERYGKVLRGFGALPPERRREIARMGAIAAHERGVAYEFTSEEAREAGRKGGTKASQDRERMREIGRKGGLARAARYRKE